MKKPLRSTAGVLAAVLVSGLLAGQAITSADAAPPAAVAVPAAAPTDCRPLVPPSPTPTPTPTPSPSGSPTGSPSPTPSPSPTVTPPPVTPDDFTPVNGTLTTNNPLGSAASRLANTTRIVRAINSTPTCGKIQIATWNFRDDRVGPALKRAVQRGVTVQMLMAAGNDTPKGTETYNPRWQQLREFLAESNKTKAYKGEGSNWAITCGGACRSSGGAAHSKYYMFSQAGNAKKVVFYGSHNLTYTASDAQWNDLYTVVDPAFYSFMDGIFKQSATRRSLATPYKRANFSTLGMDVYAFRVNNRVAGTDPMLAAMRRVKCTGAGAYGVNGRTAIRVSVAAMLNQRGQDLATKLASLKRSGCNVKVLVTQIGYNAMKTLQRSGVPLRQLARYDSRKRLFTTYTHTKVMAISGNYAGVPQKIAFNGTANWTGPALNADELAGTVRRNGVVNQYNNFVNTWYAKTPMGSRVVATTVNGVGRTSSAFSLVEGD